MRICILIFSLLYGMACGDTAESIQPVESDGVLSQSEDIHEATHDALSPGDRGQTPDQTDGTIATDTSPQTDTLPSTGDSAGGEDGTEGDSKSPEQDTASPEDVVVPLQCPPEGSEIPSSPPPSDIAAGTCEPQPVALLPAMEPATVQGTDHPSEFLYHIPDQAKGLVLFFHGGGGSKEANINRIESAFLIQATIEAGYAVASLDSVAHLDPPADGKFKWNTQQSPCNPDIKNVVALIKALKDPELIGGVPSEAPIYAVGYSNGGSMVSRAAQYIDFASVAVYISNAQQFHQPGAKIPPVFIMAGIHDNTVGIEGPCLLYGLAVDQKQDVVFKLNVPEAITPGFFTRIEGVSCAQSLEILDAYQQNGVVDEHNFLIENPKGSNGWNKALPPWATAYDSAIRDLLTERFAEHAVSSDFVAENIDFLESHPGQSTLSDLPECN